MDARAVEHEAESVRTALVLCRQRSPDFTWYLHFPRWNVPLIFHCTAIIAEIKSKKVGAEKKMISRTTKDDKFSRKERRKERHQHVHAKERQCPDAT
jgi:hypothetical protein